VPCRTTPLPGPILWMETRRRNSRDARNSPRGSRRSCIIPGISSTARSAMASACRYSLSAPVRFPISSRRSPISFRVNEVISDLVRSSSSAFLSSSSGASVINCCYDA
jgi:hypothetical protein